jgi:hypothetical protein
MQELNMVEIEQVDGAGKLALTVLGVSAGVELSSGKGLVVSADLLGFPVFGLTLPLGG